jgi:hypothetical protein
MAQELGKQGIVHLAPATAGVKVRHDVGFHGAEGRPLTFDLYSPASAEESTPVVVLVAGYRDEGFQRTVGCRFKEMQSVIDWARLIAASGLAALVATNADPATDLFALLQAIHEQADPLGIDAARIALWATSGNVPVATSALMRDAPEGIRCAAFSYGLLLDLDGYTHTADAARTYKFANPNEGRTLDDLRPDVPLFLARAGRDEVPGLNETFDRFVDRALAANLPITVSNHPTGPHAFDLYDDSEATHGIIEQIVAFLRLQLRAEPGHPIE